MDSPIAPPPPEKPRLEKWVKRIAVAATVGMFIVLMMGSAVTNTGSAEGCGRSWPLCHGEFIPSYAVETAIELSHRLVTAVEGILIAATAIGALMIRRGSREVKILVAVMVGTLVLQAGLGAAAVMWPQSAKILAAHFGISMTCFAAVFLLTRLLFEPPGVPDPITVKAKVKPLPDWFRYGTWGALVGSVVVAYVGAYMRHSGNEMGCYTWPSCNGEVYPGFDGAAGIAFTHRLAAALLMVLVYALFWTSYKLREDYPSLFTVNAFATVFITLQALAGGAVVLSELSLWTTLAHAALMAWLFVFITDACRQVLKSTRTLKTEATAYYPQPKGLPSSGD